MFGASGSAGHSHLGKSRRQVGSWWKIAIYEIPMRRNLKELGPSEATDVLGKM